MRSWASFDWTEHAEARLIELIERDGVSRSAAAKTLVSEFGGRLTRHAVCGKIDRMRGQGRMLPVRRVRRPGSKNVASASPSVVPASTGATPSVAIATPPKPGAPRPRRAPVTLPAASTPTEPDPARPLQYRVPAPAVRVGADGRPGVGLEEVTDGQCRWPLDGPVKADIRFCGRPVARAARPGRTGGSSYCPAHTNASVSDKVLDAVRDVRRLSPARRARLGLGGPSDDDARPDSVSPDSVSHDCVDQVARP